jgi:hypothetical protein
VFELSSVCRLATVTVCLSHGFRGERRRLVMI